MLVDEGLEHRRRRRCPRRSAGRSCGRPGGGRRAPSRASRTTSPSRSTTTIDVARRPRPRDSDRLAREDALQHADLVAVLRRLLVVRASAAAFIFAGELLDHVVSLPSRNCAAWSHVAAYCSARDRAHARRRAAPDLVQQARARAVREHRVVAGAQAEDLLQVADGLADRPRARERAEVAVALRVRAAIEADLRELVAGDQDVAVALVVAEEDVVARREALDEVVLEQQRLGLGARDRGLGRRRSATPSSRCAGWRGSSGSTRRRAS